VSPRAGELVGDRFELVAVAGRGGMGVVWRARDRVTGEDAAVKVHTAAHDDADVRFEQEIALARELSHPGLPRGLGDGRLADGRRWLAIAWAEGETLGKRLRAGTLEVSATIALVRALAEVLAYVHRALVVHRDLKPDNVVLLGGDVGRVMLLDFGVAKRLGPGLAAPLDERGMLVGSPRYMSPEQARSEPSVDTRSDVFSLACLAYRCLVGETPFAADDVVSMLARILLEEAPSLAARRPDAPRWFADLVGRMLAKSPDDRPSGGAAVAAALAEEGTRTRTVSTASAPAPALVTLGAREQRWMTVLLVGAGSVSASMPGSSAARAPMAERDATIAELARSSGARVDRLASGDDLLTWRSDAPVIDVARDAARAGFAIAQRLAGSAVAVVTGRATGEQSLPIGEVLDRAAFLLDRAKSRRAGGVLVDDATAGMIDERFVVEPDGSARVLLGERSSDHGARKVLGRTTPFAGREDELRALLRAYRDGRRDGLAGAVVVSGEAGLGKSRLRRELCARLRLETPELNLWIAEADASKQDAALGVAADLVRGAVGARAGTTPDVLANRLVERLAALRLEPQERALIGAHLAELLGVTWRGPAGTTAVSAHDPAALGDQLRRAWEDFVVAHARSRPTVLVVEDLQWVDRASLELVERLLRNFAAMPLLVFAFGRLDYRTRFAGPFSDQRRRVVELAPLALEASSTIASAVLGVGSDDATARSIADRAGGNPFFLEELLRAHLSGASEALPDTVLAMVERRLLRLGAEERRVLRAASVYGAAFDEAGVVAIVGDPVGTRGVLDALVREELLDELGDATFAFRQVLIRETAYAQIVDADRAELHAVAARHLARVAAHEPARVAEHAELGGDRAAAAQWWAHAAERAVAGGDAAGAIARADRAIACGARGDDRAFARLASARGHFWRGEHRDRLAHLQQIDLHAELSAAVRVRVLGELVTAAAGLGEVAIATASMTELNAALERGEVDDLGIASACFAGVTLRGIGAIELARRFVQLVRSLGDGHLRSPIARAGLSLVEAHEAHVAGDYARSTQCAEVCADLYETAGDSRQAVVQRINAGYFALLLGQFGRAVALTRAAATEADRLGAEFVAAAARHNLGLALARTGAFAEGIAQLRTSIEVFARSERRALEVAARDYLARALLLAWRTDEAVFEARQAVALVAPDHPRSAVTRATLADALLALGTESARAEGVEQATLAYERLLAVEEMISEPAFIRRVYLDALEVQGQRERAELVRAESQQWLLARAARIESPQHRAIFLEFEPNNARIMGYAATEVFGGGGI
jgi:hypothetical protein